MMKTYHSVLAVQMKNWDPLLLGPALAMDKMPTGVFKGIKNSIHTHFILHYDKNMLQTRPH